MKHTSTSTEAWSKNHNSREIEKTECANSFSELAFEWFDVIWLLPQQKNTCEIHSYAILFTPQKFDESHNIKIIGQLS